MEKIKMVHATPMKFLLEQTSLVRALSSLTRRDADAVRATLRAAGSSLAVEEHDDYDGYLSLLLTAADPNGPSYLVSGRTGAVELAELRGDDMVIIGCFAGIGPAMLTLRAVLGAREQAQAADPAAPTTAAVTSLAAELLRRHGVDADLHAAMRADAEASWKPIARQL